LTLRIGFDMDGVFADFAAAFHEIEAKIFGIESSDPVDQPEPLQASESEAPSADSVSNAYEQRRRREAVWAGIEAIPDFWTTLKPTSEGAIRRLHTLMLEHRWEVFFITQRPATAGETVQRQTQRWLVEQGFDLPSVLVIHGSRGAAAAALRLDYHIDDTTQHCLDVMTGSSARTILINPDGEGVVKNVRKLGIGTASSIDEALDILEEAAETEANPSLFKRLATRLGWQVSGRK